MNVSTARAEVLVDELVRGGVTEAVLCPGSRNAPLSFALYRAEVAGRLRLHVRIDERTAAFLALGLALRAGRAVPVVCTSGTAAANLHPAVLEAAHAGVPLLALTADRPPEMIGTGANQTIVQPGLYGGAPRLSIDLDAIAGEGAGAAAGEGAGAAAGQLAAWRSAIARAVRVALGGDGGRPGPVHVNVPFAEPLVPDADGVEPGERSHPRQVDELDMARAVGRMNQRAVELVDVLPLDPGLPTLVIGGGVPVGASRVELADGVPVVAEPASPLWPGALRAGPWLLGSPWADELRPAQVVLHGRPTLHRAVTRLLADDSVAVYAVAGTGVTGWPASVRAVGALPPLRPPPAWTRRWADADAAASRVLDTALSLPGSPVGLRLAAALVTALPVGALLTLGSSNPVRDVALAARPRTGLRVLANRGVAGIDGTVSTAVGAALAHAAAGTGSAPGYALLGDLTLLHDTTGLVLGPDEPRPDLTLVVLNDVGGGIFSLLEQGAPEHAAGFERVFGTPHRVRLEALCAGLGVAHRLVTDLAELPAALGPEPGIRVLEVPASRDGLRAGHDELRAAVRAALGSIRLG